MKTILFVDSLAFCRELLSLALRHSGYTIITAGDGIEALDLVRARNPDLVILESRLPHMDGVAVARAMRATPEMKKIPLFMVTAAEDRQQIIQAVRTGIQEYILKSRFSLDDLLARIARYIGSPFQQTPNLPTAEPAQTGASTIADPGATLDLLGQIEPCTPFAQTSA